jgi:pimeloyl-ACP methyl ester carboxylesterase
MEIHNGDVVLHVAEDGPADGTPVVVLHGITSCTRTWDWLVPLLADQHRVLRLDFRGHGESGRTPGNYHFPDYLTDAIAVCEQVAGRPAVVVGHSLGGGTAAALAQQRPDLVRALVLEDPALASSSDTMEGNSLSEAFALMRQSIPMMQEQNIPVEQLCGVLGMMPGATGAPMGEVLAPDALTAMAISLLHVDATVLDPVLDRSMRMSFDPNASIPVPGIVVAGDQAQPDTIVRQPQLDRLAATSPHLEVRVVAGAGHLIHDSVTHRHAMATAITDVIAASA